MRSRPFSSPRLSPFGLLVLFILGGVGLFAASPAVGDEIEDLLREVRPPARFADHVPRFDVEEREFTFHHAGGKIETPTWKVVRDGGHIVALITQGGINIIDFRPGEGPVELDMPTGRWHIDTLLGVTIPTGSFIPGSQWRNEQNTRVTLEGVGTDRLTLTRGFDGTVESRDKKSGAVTSQRVRVTNTLVLRCDPVTGYVVDATYDAAAEHPPKDYQFANLMAQGTYAMWPGEARSVRSAITRTDREGYWGYAHTLQAIDLSDNDRPTIRNGGFGTFLNEETGWSPTLTLGGADARYVICNAHADQDFVALWPTDSSADEGGLHHLTIRHRLLALPPEATRRVWDTMEVAFEGATTTVLRMGANEDFEDQPVSAADAHRRGAINTGGLPLNTDAAHARSGNNSLIVRGSVGPNLPQISLKPDTTYRLEAWVQVVPFDDAQRAQHRADWEERKAKLEKKGKGDQAGEYQAPPEVADAWISGDFYEWDYYTPARLGHHQTDHARSGDGSQWKHLQVEFTTPQWDPFLDLKFHCEGGTAYVDDFSLAPVDGS